MRTESGDRSFERQRAAALRHLRFLCSVRPNRALGSPGNRAATRYFARTLRPLGCPIDTTIFPCLDFEAGSASLTCAGRRHAVRPSPYSLGCDVRAELVAASSVEELEACDCRARILLLSGPICAEQLMPKNFAFYNPEAHQKIYALLERKEPAAIVTATGRNPEGVGAQYPFPLIEDGDFDIPVVHCRDTTGQRIAAWGRGASVPCRLRSTARRIPATACNVVARLNPAARRKLLVCAHIDARAGTPGASDNAGGTAVLLLLAELLRGWSATLGVEIVAFNGEDHYSAGGQMDYLRRHGQKLPRGVLAAVNIDDVGYVKGKTAFSLYGCPVALQRQVRAVFEEHTGLAEGPPWYQGDHMIFAQRQVPAVALTSERMPELMARYTHTPRDTPAIVDCSRLVETARALAALLRAL